VAPRYEEAGIEGLRPRSPRPDTSPNATIGEVIAKITHLSKTYHFGPAKISMYLKRYHDLEMSTSGVWRLLKRLEMNRLPASQRYRRHVERWKRYQRPQPGHRVQIDTSKRRREVPPLASCRSTDRPARNVLSQE
jgi:hypothetical protein